MAAFTRTTGTQNQSPTQTQTDEESGEIITLRLVNNRRVTFDSSVVNNEHMNKKISKICCIAHRKKKKGVNKYEQG